MMKVIPKPSIGDVEEYEGCIIVARWNQTGSLTSFRYHKETNWYCVGDLNAYSRARILAECEVLAVFYDEPVEDNDF